MNTSTHTQCLLRGALPHKHTQYTFIHPHLFLPPLFSSVIFTFLPCFLSFLFCLSVLFSFFLSFYHFFFILIFLSHTFFLTPFLSYFFISPPFIPILLSHTFFVIPHFLLSNTSFLSPLFFHTLLFFILSFPISYHVYLSFFHFSLLSFLLSFLFQTLSCLLHPSVYILKTSKDASFSRTLDRNCWLLTLMTKNLFSIPSLSLKVWVFVTLYCTSHIIASVRWITSLFSSQFGWKCLLNAEM